MSKIRIAVVGIAAVLALAAAVACGGGATPTPTDPADHTTAATRTPTGSPDPTTAPTTAPGTDPTDGGDANPVSVEQKNATRAAKDYLNMEGFSRKGLIQQLSSSSGDGYSVKAATAAVDSLHVNWNDQAVRVAKNYLSMEPFSRSGLIQQLESGAGEAFTHDQAVYGATKAGL